MARKIAAASSLLIFAISVLSGLAAENTFSTTLSRALLAMAATFVIGLVIGAMVDRMIAENLSLTEKKLNNLPAKTGAEDR